MIVTAPTRLERMTLGKQLPVRLFAAGGITGVEPWQDPYCKALDEMFEDLILFNPRRDNYEQFDPAVEQEQITWEFDHLRISDIITFWFSPATVQPITLLEFGKALVWAHTYSSPKVFVAAHPDYVRRRDVVIQAELEFSSINVRSSIDELIADVRDYLDGRGQNRK